MIEAEFHLRLMRNMRAVKRPYKGYAAIADQVLTDRDFGKSWLTFDALDVPELDDPEQNELAGTVVTQSRQMRLFLMDGEEPRGFVVMRTDVSAAGLGQSLEFLVTIDEAWSRFDDTLVTDAWVTSIATSLAPAMRRALWFRIANPHKTVYISVETESESPLAWSLTESLAEVLPEVVYGDGPKSLKDVTFNASICP